MSIDKEFDEYLKEDAFGTEDIDTQDDDSPEFVYSIDEEMFYDDIDEVMEMLNEDSDNEPGDRVVIYRGTPVKVRHYDIIKNLDIIGILQDVAADEDGEMAEDYLTDLSEADIDKINLMLSKILDKMAAQPNYHRVENIQPMTVTIDGIEE
jgi:hypothetical protein